MRHSQAVISTGAQTWALAHALRITPNSEAWLLWCLATLLNCHAQGTVIHSQYLWEIWDHLRPHLWHCRPWDTAVLRSNCRTEPWAFQMSCFPSNKGSLYLIRWFCLLNQNSRLGVRKPGLIFFSPNETWNMRSSREVWGLGHLCQAGCLTLSNSVQGMFTQNSVQEKAGARESK